MAHPHVTTDGSGRFKSWGKARLDQMVQDQRHEWFYERMIQRLIPIVEPRAGNKTLMDYLGTLNEDLPRERAFEMILAWAGLNQYAHQCSCAFGATRTGPLKDCEVCAGVGFLPGGDPLQGGEE